MTWSRNPRSANNFSARTLLIPLGLLTAISSASSEPEWKNDIAVCAIRGLYDKLQTIEMRYAALESFSVSPSDYVARQVKTQQRTDSAMGRPAGETANAVTLIKARGMPTRRLDAVLTVHGRQWDLWSEWVTTHQNGESIRQVTHVCFDGETVWSAQPMDKYVQKRRAKLMPIHERTPIEGMGWRILGTSTFGLPDFLHSKATLRITPVVRVGKIGCTRVTVEAPIPIEARPPNWNGQVTVQIWIESMAPHRLIKWASHVPSTYPYAQPPPEGVPQGQKVVTNEYECADYRAVADECTTATVEFPFRLRHTSSSGVDLRFSIAAIRVNHLPASHRLAFSIPADWTVQDVDAPKPAAQIISGGRKALAKRVDADIARVLEATALARSSKTSNWKLWLAVADTVLAVAIAWLRKRRLGHVGRIQ